MTGPIGSDTSVVSPEDNAPGLLGLLYGAYAASLFALLGVLALLAVFITPSIDLRTTARLFLRLVGMRLTVRGLDTLPSGQCVIVANHASYLDGLVFSAALPPRFSFVIKREMATVPLAATLLRRIGSQFVERFNRSKGAADARRVLRSASGGTSLVFFPEGTFSPRPGLLKFHAGAFITAARARCPVVPAVIRGTRAALPPGKLLPRPARIALEVLPPVVPRAQQAATAALELRERARTAILLLLREPDLSAA